MGNKACCCERDDGGKPTTIVADTFTTAEDPYTGAGAAEEPFGSGPLEDDYKLVDGTAIPQPEEDDSEAQNDLEAEGDLETDFDGELEPDEGPDIDCEAAYVAEDFVADPPYNVARELTLTVERDRSDIIGLGLDTLDARAVFVEGIDPGAIKTWNETQPSDMRLMVNDRIVGVNGITRGRTHKLLSEMKNTCVWMLTVQRPVQILVVIDREQCPVLGLELEYAPLGRNLLICEVRDGAIKDWNAGPQELKVKRNDRIVKINGSEGRAEMLLSLAAQGVSELAILIYA